MIYHLRYVSTTARYLQPTCRSGPARSAPSPTSVSAAVLGVVAAGGLSGELLYTIIIPVYVFLVLLIGSSVLACREG